MEYTLEMAERMAERLRGLPAIDDSKRRLNKQTVVRHLAAEIVSLQQRGYTIEQVAESLRGVGLDITTPTLKSYLQRTRKQSKGTSRRRSARAPGGPARSDRTKRTTPAPVAKDAKEAEKPSEPEAPRSTRGEFIATDRQRL